MISIVVGIGALILTVIRWRRASTSQAAIEATAANPARV